MRDRSRRPSPIEAAFLQYEAAVRRVIGRMVPGNDEVHDLAQDAFLRALAAERRGGIQNAKAYLFETARNAARNELARRSRKVQREVEDALDRDYRSDEPSQEEVLLERERMALFAEAIASLPPQCRKVFLMCKMEGKGQREVARLLDISESTVEKHVAAGLARCAAYVRGRNASGLSVLPTKGVRTP